MEAFTKSIQFFSELHTLLQISFRYDKMINYGVLLVIITLCHTDCKPTSNCDKKTAVSGLDSTVDMIAKVKSSLPIGTTANSTCEEKMAECYLDTAVGMIKEVKSTIPASISCEKSITRRAIDCSELLQMGYTTSGVYTIWPSDSVTEDLKVYCDMQTNGGGWTLIQRRGNFQSYVDYFYKGWKSYKEGFGDIEKDFWLGNDNIYALTNQRIYSVRFDLKDVENNTRYAEYSTFWIDDENHKYKLHVTDYTGDAGNCLFPRHNNQKFSTKDQDNDNDKSRNCALTYKGAWWYNDCHDSNLNGLYHRGRHGIQGEGVNWKSWKGYDESLDSTEIKIRPKYIK